MSIFNTIKTLAFAGSLALSANAAAQTQVKQVIVANGGKFEFAAPFEDYVTVSAYNPATQQSNTFATVYTQSVIDLQIDNGTLFLAAQDSIVRYNLDTYAATGKAYFNAVRKLKVADSKLLVGKFYGSGAFFHIYDKATLQPLHSFSQIANEVKDIAVIGDTAYVAHNKQNNNYNDSVGYIGVVKISTGQFIRNIDLGQRGAGISRLFVQGKKVIGVANRKKMLYHYNTVNAVISHDSIGVSNGIALINNTLYANFKRGIGSYDLSTQQITDTVIVDTADIAAAAFDVVNNRFYITQTDFFSYIKGGIYNLAGEKIGVLPVGFSPEAIGIDYRTTTSTAENIARPLAIYPNPSAGNIWVQLPQNTENATLQVHSITGQKTDNVQVTANTPVNLSHLPRGIYVLEMRDNSGFVYRSRFVKQ